MVGRCLRSSNPYLLRTALEKPGTIRISGAAANHFPIAMNRSVEKEFDPKPWQTFKRCSNNWTVNCTMPTSTRQNNGLKFMPRLFDVGHRIFVIESFASAMHRLLATLPESENDFLPNIQWGHYTSGPSAGNWDWGVTFFSRSYMCPEKLVRVGNLELHIDPSDRNRLRDKVIHFLNNRLVVCDQEFFQECPEANDLGT